ncbi:MAG: hypothetical protein FWG56_09925 [Desulfovibrionaceae bacterium]|jgi:hypothetical protein|nr:hypothetical protein [Desulfovibrionaceae bacterium]
MIDEQQVRELIAQYPPTKAVEGIVMHVGYEVKPDWTGEESVYLQVFVVDPNSDDKKVRQRAIKYTEDLREHLREGGVLTYVEFLKSRRRAATPRMAAKQSHQAIAA